MEGKIYDYFRICDEIKKIDPKIIFSEIVNERGRLAAGGSPGKIVLFRSKDDNEKTFMELALRVKMRKGFDRQLGPVNFAMSLRQKIIALNVPLNQESSM